LPDAVPVLRRAKSVVGRYTLTAEGPAPSSGAKPFYRGASGCPKLGQNQNSAVFLDLPRDLILPDVGIGVLSGNIIQMILRESFEKGHSWKRHISALVPVDIWV
jgi:hypothetical protein